MSEEEEKSGPGCFFYILLGLVICLLFCNGNDQVELLGVRTLGICSPTAGTGQATSYHWSKEHKCWLAGNRERMND
jgi:hypothetical protein